MLITDFHLALQHPETKFNYDARRLYDYIIRGMADAEKRLPEFRCLPADKKLNFDRTVHNGLARRHVTGANSWATPIRKMGLRGRQNSENVILISSTGSDANDSIESLSASDLIRLVHDLDGVVGVFRAENERLKVALAKLRAEHQIVNDELARLKNLPPRPPIKASVMDKATQRGGGPGTDGKKGPRSTRRRGSQLEKLTIGQTIVVKAKASDGSRHKGYEDIVIQDLSLSPTATLYRRERWETPEGGAIVAELAPGIVGGYGPHLHRLMLMLHTRAQMTCERILALLDDMGVVISKRQVVRLLTTKPEISRDEDDAVLKAGLVAIMSWSMTPGPDTPAPTATPRRSTWTAFVCFAAVRVNRGWLSFRDRGGEPRST